MIDIALAKVDANIKMFEAYRPTPSTLATLASLRAERAELVAHAADSSNKLSYAASMWLFEMPAWGYSGT
tara:strand:- start:1037 stop:1246 length:210 start_codon:yes stop_codon:yes gene_type:complete